MSQCSVDFFDRELTLVHHDVIDRPTIDDDYLSSTNNEIVIGATKNVKNGNLIHIKGPETDFIGVVTDVGDDEDLKLTKVTYQSIVHLFDHNIMFDTNYQTSIGSATTLEQAINKYIISYHRTDGGTLPKDNDAYIFPTSVLDVLTGSSTTIWGFNLKSDVESMHHCKIGFYSVLLQKALTKYGVVISPSFDYSTKKFRIMTGTISVTKVIDADLPNVKIQTFQIQSPSSTINKLEIWNAKNFTQVVYYYLHPDGSYDTDKNQNRIEPVNWDVMAVSEEEDGEGHVTKTFEEVAREQAVSTLGGISWTNLIELEVTPNDPLIKPLEIPIGQKVNIYHDGTMYSTILTGRKMGDIVTLVFGTIRLDLTKKLKLGGN